VRGQALSTVVAVCALFAAITSSAAAQVPAPPAPVPAPGPAPVPPSGGVAYGLPPAPVQPLVPGLAGQIVNGYASAPDQAPDPVKQAIWATNTIVGMPYVYGGGHNLTFTGKGFDCSGTVSFALHGGGLLAAPRDSSSFARYGAGGPGRWITVYTNPGHAFVVIAGIRLDTSAAGDPAGGKGPRWRPVLRSTAGYRARHPIGL
jgi:hypothetical protein